MPKYGQMLSPDAHGIVVLEEFTLDPVAALKEQNGFRAAMAAVALTMRRLVALRLFIAAVAIANLPLFLLSSGWEIYVVSIVLVVAVHTAVSWLNRHEPRIKQRRMLELHLHRERSANYRKVRDAVKYVIDAPARMNESLYLELLAAKRVALHLAMGPWPCWTRATTPRGKSGLSGRSRRPPEPARRTEPARLTEAARPTEAPRRRSVPLRDRSGVVLLRGKRCHGVL